MSTPDPNQQDSPDTPESAGSPWPVFWVVSLSVFLVSMDGTLLFAAFSALRSGFPSASAADLSWVLNGYTVVYAALLIPAGRLADSHGRKTVFMAGVALFLAASVACGLAVHIGWLVGARVLQSIGAALLTPSSLSIVLAAFPISQRAIAVSLWGAVGGLAAAVGPSLGAFVVASAGWQWAFYLNIPMGIFVLWRGSMLLTEAKRKAVAPPLDLAGMALLIVGIAAIALSIVQADSPDWSGNELLIAAGVGLASIIAFIVWARVSTSPMVDLGLFRSATYRYVNLATLSFGAAFSMMFFAFFFYMQSIWNYPLSVAGLAVAPGPLMVIPVAALSGRFASRHGHRPLLVVGSLIFALSAVWFLWVPGTEPAYLTHWLPGMLLGGVGVGMVMPSLSGAAVSQLPAEHYAVGSAINQTIRQIGSVMGIALTVLLLGSAHLERADFDPIYMWHIGLALLTAALSLRVNTSPKTTTTAGDHEAGNRAA
jgi:EmrB/QacA subfamily drug resistance transporter